MRPNGEITETLTRAERRQKVLNLRVAGCTYQMIADRLKCSVSTVYRDVQGELRKLAAKNQLTAAEYRELELQRLDILQAGVWSQAVQGDLKSVDRVIAISRRRASLLGLDAPIEVINSWREELQEAGFDPSATFQKMVEAVEREMMKQTGDGYNGN